MVNEVFANGLEIACKAGDGKSVACFPDVCFSPPAPPAGWIPIPYPNTAYARDTTSGSTTVFISGKPVMKKDRSYFRTSTGNEAAAGPKGIVTGVKKGKAYFASWSMNVMIEGENVDRHTDLMTHNHASMPGNTGVWHFLDTKAEKAACKREKERVEKACGGMKRVPGRLWGSNWVDAGKPVSWKLPECGVLIFKPFKLKSQPDVDTLLGQIKERLGRLDDIDGLVSEAMGAVKEQLIGMGATFLVKQAVKKVPVVGWVWQAVSLKGDIAQGAQMVQVWDAAQAEAERINNQVRNIHNDLTNLRDKIAVGDFDGAAGQLAEWQRTAATLNDCTRARKCMLVPFKEAQKSGRLVSVKSRDGCCPGQTGHHLIPDTYLKQGQGCSGYSKREAPVVCAEGANQYHGSHGALHGAMDKAAARHQAGAGNIRYDDAVDAAIESHTQIFPFSLCSVDCLKAQLDNYYKGNGKCSDSDALKFKQIAPSPTTSDDM